MSESKHEVQEFKADATVWYEDGNIVLLAGKTAFRLYKGVLASVSPVFKDMFSWAKPDIVSENSTIDGCPVICLADSPTDLRHFLIVITTGFVELLDCTSLVSFSRLAATVRIAHKYQAERTLKAAASRLRQFFARDLITEMNNPNLSHDTGESFWIERQKECGIRVPMDGATGIEVVTIARLLGYDDMLPVALLLCYDGDPLLLRNGVRRKDGTIAKLSDGEYLGCVEAIPELTRLLHELGVDIMRRCASTAPAKGCLCKKVLGEMGKAYQKELFSGPLRDGFTRFSWRNSPPKAYLDRRKALCDKCLLRMGNTFTAYFSGLKLEVLKTKTGYMQLAVGEAK